MYYSRIIGFYEALKFDKYKNFHLSIDIPNNIKEYYCTNMSKYSVGGGWENDDDIENFYLSIDMCDGQYRSSKENFLKLLSIYGRMSIVIYYPSISFAPDEIVSYQIIYNKLIALNFNIISVNRYYIRKYLFE